MESYQQKALILVDAVIKERLEKTDPEVRFQTYIVWFTKTLDNWKALVSSTLPDGRHYEVTYNGVKKETYIDTYVKVDNLCVPDYETPAVLFIGKSHGIETSTTTHSHGTVREELHRCVWCGITSDNDPGHLLAEPCTQGDKKL
jgi:hypothetical protein